MLILARMFRIVPCVLSIAQTCAWLADLADSREVRTSPPIQSAAPSAPLFDCNSNGIEDAVDIALGSSSDTNENGVPDECEGLAPTHQESLRIAWETWRRGRLRILLDAPPRA